MRVRASITILVLAIVFVILPFVSLGFGAAAVPFGEAVEIVWGKLTGSSMEGWQDNIVAIIWLNRVPRIVNAYGVGMVLGVAGVAMQAAIRNPLAEPYVLGISSGASAGAAVAIVIVGTALPIVTAFSAFLGALGATALVLIVGSSKTGSSLRLVLAGVAFGFIFQALTNLLMIMAQSAETAQSIVYWGLGSLARADLTRAVTVLIAGLIIAIGLWVASPYLDALASGDKTMVAIGLNPMVVRLALLIPLSAVIAMAVASSGGIGFVGLVIPHLMRPLVGHRHAPLVVSTALCSSIFLLITDTIARTVLAPAEIPIGVLTALVGAPFLVVMATRAKAMQ